MAHTADAVAAGDLSARMPLRCAHGHLGRLARSVNRMLGQAEQTLSATAQAEAAARDSSARMGQVIADTAGHLRRPVSVLAGLAEHYRERGQTCDDDLDGMMQQVAEQASRLEVLLDDLRPG
jgi:two-component system, OmpR family, sensor kinase